MNGAAATTGASWSTWREMAEVLTQPQHLKRTVIIALVVGTAFFAMNQLSLVLAGRATPLVWFKAVLTYLTPLCVSSIGVLSATHRRKEERRSESRAAAAPINQGGDR
jgi:hypothetical protein